MLRCNFIETLHTFNWAEPCGETVVTSKEPPVSLAGQNQESADTDSSSRGGEEPDRLDLDSRGEKLSPGRVKVRPEYRSSPTQPTIQKLTHKITHTPGITLSMR